jgi:hypothetical protein
MKLGILFSFAAGFLVATLLGFRGGPAADCRVGDMGGALNAQAGKSLEQVFGAWVHNARQCHVGDYLVTAPSATGQADILVARNGKAFYVAISATRTGVVDDGRVLYEWDRSRKVITYAAYDTARKGWVETERSSCGPSNHPRAAARCGKFPPAIAGCRSSAGTAAAERS